LIYKSKYPKDVDVSISYVGPLPNAREDRRMDEMILEKLDNLECADELDEIQKFALKNDDEIVPLIDSLAKADSITFNRVNTSKALEYAVLELTFSFLQLGYPCEEVPTELEVDTVFKYLNNIVGYDFYCDQTIAYFEPAFYQFMTENGYYGFIHEPFDPWLDDLDVYDNAIFAPQNIPLDYDRDYLTKTRVFLYHKGDKVIYIQGENDPWAACRFIPPTEREALYIEKVGGDHRTRIGNLEPKDQQSIYDTLEKWLKIEVNPLKNDND